MSKAARFTDAERTATMLDLLHRRFVGPNAMGISHVLLQEVAPGTGWSGANRWADVLVLGIWRSSGKRLDGYEIKASKADLKRELSDPRKHEAVARYCDSWTLVAWDESVLTDGIPDGWGILLTREIANSYGAREFITHRRAEKRTPDPWPREFICSLVRNAYEQAPGAAYVARAVEEASRRGLREGREQGKHEVERLLEPLKQCLYGDGWYRRESTDQIVKDAIARLNQHILAPVAKESA